MEHPILTMRGAAHDIRGYLAGAALETEHLSEHDDCRIAKRAARISKAIDKVVSICQTDLTGIGTFGNDARLNAKDLEGLLYQVFLLAGPRGEDRSWDQRMSVSVDADVELECNQAHLFRIIFNLTVNAVRAINEHGCNRVELRAERVDGTIKISVCDDGPGLPPHIIDHLYPRIDRPVPAGKRIGFGLMSAVMLANEIRGHLQLVHTSGRGTEFCLSLSAAAT